MRIEDLRGYWAYRVVDRLRLENPRQAANVALPAVRRVDHRLLPWLLGAMGSALRRLGHLRPALGVFDRAFQLATLLEDRRSTAMLHRRVAHVYCDFGDNRGAIGHSHIALRYFAQVGDGAGQGRVLVDLGKWFFHLEEYDESRRCNHGALRLLPSAERDHRFSAMLANAYVLEEVGDLEGADHWMSVAWNYSQGVRTVLVASLLFMRGRLARRRGLYEAATQRFGVAYDFYLERGFYLLAVTTALQLCEIHLLRGRPNAAAIVASDSVQLVRHLQESPVVRGIVISLTEHVAAGRPLTLKLLADLRRRNELASNQPPGSG